MIDYPYSRQITNQSGSSFALSFYFLSKERRNGIRAVYAFSRLVDDAVDEAKNDDEARHQLALWRSWLESCYQKGLAAQAPGIFHPLLPELIDAIQRFKIPQSYFSDLLTGCEMDLAHKRYKTFAELEVYCYHVAGTIGLLCNQLFGFEGEKARQYALLLGTAFQLTNIIRDVGIDAKLGRIYIPQDEMGNFGVKESEILSGRLSPAFLDLMSYQAERAESYFQKASALLEPAEKKKILPAQIMAAFYHRILHKLVKQKFPVFKKKVSLSAVEKAGLAAKVLVLG